MEVVTPSTTLPQLRRNDSGSIFWGPALEESADPQPGAAIIGHIVRPLVYIGQYSHDGDVRL